MDITKNFQVHATGRREPLFLKVECSPSNPLSVDNYLREEYVLKGTIGVTFRAPAAHYQEALQGAKRQLYRVIYQPMIDELVGMQEAIWAQDYQQIKQTCNKLMRMMEGLE